jgi:hypothetical protein
MATPLMPIEKTIRSMAATLARVPAAYTGARARLPELAPHATPKDAARGLEYGRPGREALVAAILTEHQRTPHPIWHSILIVACERTLVRLRKRMSRNPHDEDRDQDVLLGFLEAMRTVRVDAYALLALKMLTKAHAFGIVETEQRMKKERADFNDDRFTQNPFATPTFDKVAAAEIMHLVETRGGAELLKAIVATEANDEPLAEYVDRTYADRTPEERVSAYDRLWAARSKVLAELRRRLAA